MLAWFKWLLVVSSIVLRISYWSGRGLNCFYVMIAPKISLRIFKFLYSYFPDKNYIIPRIDKINYIKKYITYKKYLIQWWYKISNEVTNITLFLYYYYLYFCAKYKKYATLLLVMCFTVLYALWFLFILLLCSIRSLSKYSLHARKNLTKINSHKNTYSIYIVRFNQKSMQ